MVTVPKRSPQVQRIGWSPRIARLAFVLAATGLAAHGASCRGAANAEKAPSSKRESATAAEHVDARSHTTFQDASVTPTLPVPIAGTMAQETSVADLLRDGIPPELAERAFRGAGPKAAPVVHNKRTEDEKKAKATAKVTMTLPRVQARIASEAMKMDPWKPMILPRKGLFWFHAGRKGMTKALENFIARYNDAAVIVAGACAARGRMDTMTAAGINIEHPGQYAAAFHKLGTAAARDRIAGLLGNQVIDGPEISEALGRVRLAQAGMRSARQALQKQRRLTEKALATAGALLTITDGSPPTETVNTSNGGKTAVTGIQGKNQAATAAAVPIPTSLARVGWIAEAHYASEVRALQAQIRKIDKRIGEIDGTSLALDLSMALTEVQRCTASLEAETHGLQQTIGAKRSGVHDVGSHLDQMRMKGSDRKAGDIHTGEGNKKEYSDKQGAGRATALLTAGQAVIEFSDFLDELATQLAATDPGGRALMAQLLGDVAVQPNKRLKDGSWAYQPSARADQELVDAFNRFEGAKEEVARTQRKYRVLAERWKALLAQVIPGYRG